MRHQRWKAASGSLPPAIARVGATNAWVSLARGALRDGWG
jgi:hypothetical protein